MPNPLQIYFRKHAILVRKCITLALVSSDLVKNTVVKKYLGYCILMSNNQVSEKTSFLKKTNRHSYETMIYQIIDFAAILTFCKLFTLPPDHVILLSVSFLLGAKFKPEKKNSFCNFAYMMSKKYLAFICGLQYTVFYCLEKK